MVEVWDERGPWGCSVWNLLVWDVVCGIIGGSEQGHRSVRVRWSLFCGLVTPILVGFILTESCRQSTLSNE